MYQITERVAESWNQLFFHFDFIFWFQISWITKLRQCFWHLCCNTTAKIKWKGGLNIDVKPRNANKLKFQMSIPLGCFHSLFQIQICAFPILHNIMYKHFPLSPFYQRIWIRIHPFHAELSVSLKLFSCSRTALVFPISTVLTWAFGMHSVTPHSALAYYQNYMFQNFPSAASATFLQLQHEHPPIPISSFVPAFHSKSAFISCQYSLRH